VAFQAATRFGGGLAFADFAVEVGACGGVSTGLGHRDRVGGRDFSWRLPPRFSRWRWTRPLEAGTGAVPVCAAKAAGLRKRPMPRVSPRILAATIGPTPRIASTVEHRVLCGERLPRLASDEVLRAVLQRRLDQQPRGGLRLAGRTAPDAGRFLS
jgi:hypothetical protein